MPHDPRHPANSAASDAAALALAALGWILGDNERAERYLELTGLDPAALRAGLEDRAVLASALDFLANYEPDLIRAADALAIMPEELAAAHMALAERNPTE